MPNYHNLFIVAVVVVITIFVLCIIGIVFMNGEEFTNFVNEKPQKAFDSVVPSNLGYRDATSFYQNIGDGLKGTPLVNVTESVSNRYPIAVEVSTNWYSTQPLTSSVGTNNGKLSDCMCEDKFSI